MAASFRFDLDEGAVAAIADSAEAAGLMQEVGDKIVARARSLAPKLTGAGAASIHAEVSHEDGAAIVKVAWDREHGYMSLQETGTENMSPNPFLRPALDSTRI